MNHEPPRSGPFAAEVPSTPPGAVRRAFRHSGFDIHRFCGSKKENDEYRITNDELKKSLPFPHWGRDGGTSTFGVRYSTVRHSKRMTNNEVSLPTYHRVEPGALRYSKFDIHRFEIHRFCGSKIICFSIGPPRYPLCKIGRYIFYRHYFPVPV